MNLITGATGLVGSHLALKLLDNNEIVTAIYRSKQSIQKTLKLFKLYNKEQLFEKINWIEADILDIPSLEKAFENISNVYHCAAYVSLSSEDEKIYKINIEGTANIVNLCIDFKIKKLCYVSSIAALGEPKKDENIITEESIWNPNADNTDYAISKYGGEIEVHRASQEGVDVIIVNPGIILGPEFWNHGSARFYKQIKNGMPFYTKGKSGFVAVIDLVEIMIQLMNSNIKQERFIIVADNIRLDHFLFKIAESINSKKPKIYLNPWVTNVASKIDWLLWKLKFKKRSFSKSMSNSAHSTTEFSNLKIKKTLNYNFRNTNEYIKEIGNHYLEHLKTKN